MSDKPLLNERQIASMFRLSIATLRRWRYIRKGPRFIKLGVMVRYRPEDVEAWLNSKVQEPRERGADEIPQ